MTRTTRRGKDFLLQGFSSEDLKPAKWFLDAVAPLYHGALHSHLPALAVSDAKGGRTLTSLSALCTQRMAARVAGRYLDGARLCRLHHTAPANC